LILFSPFFTNDCAFRCTIGCPLPSPDGATIFAKLRSKIAKTLKICGKVCAHNFIYIAERF